MGATIQGLGKRLLALTGALALGATALLGGAAAAQADETPEFGNIDFEREGSISIHKRTQASGDQDNATGELNPNAPGEPLGGITFTVQQIDLDLSDSANWEGLESLTAESAVDTHGVTGPVYEETTDTVTGTALFDRLLPGVYVAKELPNANVTTPAADFLVVIPLSPQGEWLYDIHVYPKNSIDSTHDKVLDEDADAVAYGAGDTVTWNLSSNIQVPAAGSTITSVSIEDTLDSRLGYQNVSNVRYDGETLNDGVDYEVTTSGQVVTFTLLGSGLTKVNAQPGLDLTFDLNTIVTADEITIDNGTISNGSKLRVNDQDWDSVPATTNWGNVNIFKFDANSSENERVGLEDAEFQVFTNEADARSGENPVEINGETTFATDENGNLAIGPLNAGAENLREYWVVETKAPAGFELPSVFEDRAELVEVKAGLNASVVWSLPNAKQPDITLPLTGATGTWMFVLGGVALVAVATGIALRSRRAHA